MTFSSYWASPDKLRSSLIDLVARAPGRVQTKLLVAFLTIASLLVIVGALALAALNNVDRQTQKLIKLQREIGAYRQVQQDTTRQLYGVATALLFPDDPTLEEAMRQLNQFGYDFNRLEFVSKQQPGLIDQLRQEYRKLTASVRTFAQLVRTGRNAEARDAQMSLIVPQADRLQRLTNQLVNIAEADMVAAIDATMQAYGQSKLVVGAFSFASVLLALGLGYVISWSIVGPVRTIEARLRDIAASNFDEQITVTNRDELGSLAANVNRTSVELGRLYGEAEVRRREVTEALQQQMAVAEVSQAVNSTLDLGTVLSTIVAKAVQLSGTEAGAIYVYSKARRAFRLRATYGMPAALIKAVAEQVIRIGETPLGLAAERREPVQVADLRHEPPHPVSDIILAEGFHALLVLPLLKADSVVGGLVVRRRAAGSFSDATIGLLQTFAAQSALAIQNARMFHEIQEKSEQLEIASRHKSQFLANMSHELRTPLNAILGYTELVLDGIYGQPSETVQDVLGRVEANGKHLLGLINDVLDLSKIEAGQLALAIADYSMPELVRNVAVVVEPLANEKNLSLKIELAESMPVGLGDERRLTQVLLNLVGNAIKFTDVGEVRIKAMAVDSRFELTVADTGPGVAPGDRDKIFEEFQQADTSSTRKKGGTGLGLAISRRIVEMHGGQIHVASTPLSGSTFCVSLPINAAAEAASV